MKGLQLNEREVALALYAICEWWRVYGDWASTETELEVVREMEALGQRLSIALEDGWEEE